jgi:osmotically-inducible protein OsmY
MIDTELRRKILEIVEFNPAFDASRVSVCVDDLIVTLSGWVPSEQEKDTLVAAVQNIEGVDAVADELQVGLMPRQFVRDEDLARQVAAVVRHAIQPAPDRLHIRVEQGWVTLSGEVDSFFQGREIEREVGRLADVEGITNNINRRADPASAQIEAHIRRVFERDLFQAPDALTVSSFGGKVTLEGSVHSEEEKTLAERTAELVDGVTFVENRLSVCGCRRSPDPGAP